ncbi:zincin [Clavulina sp. PMI_390]|nr:zincin [Clavulina sp. PMI_390]
MEAEQRPLLAGDDDDHDVAPTTARSSGNFFETLLDEPLTTLTRLLLFVSVGLLLLASIFIGLFAGAEHRISDLLAKPPVTVTEIVTTSVPTTVRTTATTVRTTTALATTTEVVSTTRTITTTTTSIIAPPTEKPEPPRPEVCTSAECVILAASILEGMNQAVDPCEDFYEFANGYWIQDHPLPSGKSRYGSFDQLQEHNNLVVQRILDDVETPDNAADQQSSKKLKAFHKSCTNQATLNAKGSEPLLDVIRKIRTLFPVQSKLPDPISKQAVFSMSGPLFDHELTGVLAYLHSIGIGALFDLGIEGDYGNDPNAMVLWASQSELGLPAKEYYDDPDSIAEYRLALKDLLVILDESHTLETAPTSRPFKLWPPWPFPPEEPPAENKTARAERLADEIIKFETRLAKIGADLDVLLTDPVGTYNPQPLSNWTEHITPFMSFSNYLSAFTTRNFPETVVVTYPPYFPDLSSLVQSTTGEVLQAYFVSQAALGLAPYLGLETEPWRIVTEFSQALNGIKKGTPVDRGKWCLGQMQGSLGFMAGRFFVEDVFSPSSREKAFDVVDSIITAFNKNLPNLEWMAPKDREAAAEKASSLYIKVGYPLLAPNTTSATSVASYYRIVKIKEDEFLANVLSARTSANFRQWLQLGNKRNKESWEMYPSQVNAYYNPPANEIVFPAGILRPPFFNRHWPNYMSYGAIGAVVAHELTHAFDNSGRLFNQEGKLETWWSDETSEAFNERQQCLAKQYSSYTIEDGKGGVVHVNGNLTSGENIGDSGLVHAWRAWKAAAAELALKSNTSLDYRLPGLEDFTPEQLFFLAFGRIWASTILPGASVIQVRTDPHSPAQFRVQGTISNMPEFAEAWKCSPKAKLNPKERCVFW